MLCNGLRPCDCLSILSILLSHGYCNFHESRQAFDVISEEVTGLLHHQHKSMPYHDGKLLSHVVVLAINYKWLSLPVSHPVVLVSG